MKLALRMVSLILPKLLDYIYIYIKLLAHMRCYLFRMDYDGCAKLVKIYVVSNPIYTLEWVLHSGIRQCLLG